MSDYLRAGRRTGKTITSAMCTYDAQLREYLAAYDIKIVSDDTFMYVVQYRTSPTTTAEVSYDEYILAVNMALRLAEHFGETMKAWKKESGVK